MTTTPRDPTTLRLLQVEDSPADALLMREYLRDLAPGATFDTATRLSEVTVERVEAADCALLDLSLPDAAGLDALFALRRLSEDLPIIVLTGFDDMRLGLVAVREGADDYLFKNHVDAATLVRAVQYAIGRRGLMLRLGRSAERSVGAAATTGTARAAELEVLRQLDDGAAGEQVPARAQAAEGRRSAGGRGAVDPTARGSALLTPAEVAAILYVDPKTVSRWADDGKIASVRTPGGHRRFFRSEILALVHGTGRNGT